MRASFFVVVLLVPTVAAWSVEIDAPAVAGEGLPFLVEICADAPEPWQLRVLAENATLDRREDRYGASVEGARCEDVEVRPGVGVVRLDARVRAAAGGSPRARAAADVALVDAPAAMCARGGLRDDDGALLLRAPARGAWWILPALSGSDACAPASVRVVEARAAPRAGVTLVNDGPGIAALAAYDGLDLPDVVLGPGERIDVAWQPRAGAIELRLAERVAARLEVPKLAVGTVANATGVHRYGRTNVAPEPVPTHGALVAYATPESDHAALVALVDAAEREVRLAAMTLTSLDVAAALARAADRGVDVRVLLDASPPGGVPPDERAILAALVARGVDARLLGGEGARYRTMHAKMAAIDRAAAWIATENLNDARSRGYGLALHDASIAARIADVLDADIDGHDVRVARFEVAPAELVPGLPRAGEPLRLDGARVVTLVFSPDAPVALADAVRSARSSLDAQMLRADADGVMIDALVGAARQGARVRLLLDGRHDDGVNRETAARVVALARREGLALEAKLADPARTVHAKVFVVDARVVYVGSMNWVRAAVEENREAGVLVEDEALAAWLRGVMDGDWTGPAVVVREVPAPSVVALILALSAGASRRPRVRGRGRT